MAFLDQDGLRIFKNQCDSHYVNLDGKATTQTVSSSSINTLGLKLTSTKAVIGQKQTADVYGPTLQMYDKNGEPCGQLSHAFRSGSTAASSVTLSAQNKTSSGAYLYGGLTVYRAYNVASDTDGTTYWFSSKPNVRTAIGIFSGTAAPTTNTSRANGDIYIQY